MDPKWRKRVDRRKRLLRQLAELPLAVHGSYVERLSTCARDQCACHCGEKHGPRAYVVVYRDGRQRQRVALCVFARADGTEQAFGMVGGPWNRP